MFIPKKKANRNEADTRADHIDPRLEFHGWGKDTDSRIRREYPITLGRILVGGKRTKPLSADYVLMYKGQRLAVVEAKKEGLSYADGVRQALDYAKRLQCRFAYATNGHEIYLIDMLTGEEGLVDNYLSPAEMYARIINEEPSDTPDFKRVWQEGFAAIPFETKGDWQPRYYQENAITNALNAISAGSPRVLLTLATGTGKTCIAFQTSWKLFQSRWSLTAQRNPDEAKRRPRILFLADRNILANQAFNDFGPFGEDAIVRITPADIRKRGGVPKNASVFFTIFHTLMSGPNSTVEEDEEAELVEDENAYYKQYPRDFFDLIIIDECHRGGASDESTWRRIMEYFEPAVQIGLTATPKRRVNADTYRYFGDPVYSYTLKEGINDGYLTPFRVFPIVGTMDEYVYTEGDGVVVEGNPEPGRVYREGDFNRIITIPEREEKRVHYWMDAFKPNEKTIVFCATQEHAGRVRDYINQYAKHKGWTTNNSYCVRVTANDGQAGENDLNTFSDNEKTIPTILTTSKKLSTGVDARNVRNIVLMRPCNDMVEFKQIIGRGTRMYEGKDFFTIYDFVKAHHNFADPEWDGEPLPPPELCDVCGDTPCSCEQEPCDVCGFSPCNCPTEPCGVCGREPCICLQPPCEQCGESPCVCVPEPCGVCGEEPCICNRTEKILIKLSDGKTREIKHIKSAMYWFGDKPITAKEFIERLFDDLPKFFEDEDQLRAIWSDPTTREKLLENLTEAGYDEDKLEGMKDLIDAKDSDVYDVLRYVAFAAEALTRKQRASTAHPKISATYASDKQQQFIDFVLDKYVEDGVTELSRKKMRSLIDLKYGTIDDAIAELGQPSEIRETFVGFQRYLYE
ncbi:Type I restriction-modification system, restriction subunit R [Alteromonas macleodii]|jgi:type I restriction enzyme R subunit|uniref:EcoAI/FtnUII family type I restriction enzme subunit R n=1 Tax=Alteromonas sp. MmMcT2-2 TaxID=2917732 RepID=UPI001EF26B7F|nr:DEAD/DEAH box helicase family protein [Alteromonas sp. MmMcT2-2]MCG7642160.1 DEAD/DEAH box helicase family protein [Alteromonas sp. MmMcT2-2]